MGENKPDITKQAAVLVAPLQTAMRNLLAAQDAVEEEPALRKAAAERKAEIDAKLDREMRRRHERWVAAYEAAQAAGWQPALLRKATRKPKPWRRPRQATDVERDAGPEQQQAGDLETAAPPP
jgi:hypothetical protein